MKVSVMTNLFSRKRNGEMISTFESIEYCKEAGFNALDLSLTALFRNESEFNAENWRELAVALREKADRLGVSFFQSHLPYGFSRVVYGVGEGEFLVEMTHRALEISSIAGVKWAVVHPVNCVGTSCEDTEAHLKANHQAYDQFVNKAKDLGIGIAFENMVDTKVRRFGSLATELVALVDSFTCENVGVCWDFGHGALMYENQTEGIRRVGKRLKAVHVADNWGANDDHMPPFIGNNNWEEIMKVLREIGFDGNMVFEVKINSNMPDELKVLSAVYCAKLGEYLISL
ncbi:MAG TPA: sugar phosphate isomerase/epimerase [Clostridiaceae bacterium]|nr:sugar phosphate isomerase/epimerase [Clostridiaceae bacterium]